eukprot:TRINITY_DN23282_c1_g1_i1.p1 TRINITY_DN23282_c1_g1~~TRINITY_DN23282_c1_g1_i1.p1  ORF type:complete len:397 (-),score=113.27 TRINITY_DN23282_c1_g1_i1:151-1341(-)
MELLKELSAFCSAPIFGKENAIVSECALKDDKSVIAACTSDMDVNIFDTSKLESAIKLNIPCEDKSQSRINHLSFFKDFLLVSAFDQSVSMGTFSIWDISKKEMVAFIKKEYNIFCHAVNCDGAFVALGTAEGCAIHNLAALWDGSEHHIVDICNHREESDRFLGTAEPSVSQVAFHPVSGHLYEAGLDGLINVHDLSLLDSEEMDPDDAYVYTFDAESDVRKMGFFGPQSQGLYTTTGSEDLFLFDTMWASEEEPTTESDRFYVFEGLRAGISEVVESNIDYIVNCCCYGEELLLLVGNAQGVCHLLKVGMGELSHIGTFNHSAICRCFTWIPGEDAFYSATEAGLISKWRVSEATDDDHKESESAAVEPSSIPTPSAAPMNRRERRMRRHITPY